MKQQVYYKKKLMDNFISIESPEFLKGMDEFVGDFRPYYNYFKKNLKTFFKDFNKILETNTILSKQDFEHLYGHFVIEINEDDLYPNSLKFKKFLGLAESKSEVDNLSQKEKDSNNYEHFLNPEILQRIKEEVNILLVHFLIYSIQMGSRKESKNVEEMKNLDEFKLFFQITQDFSKLMDSFALANKEANSIALASKEFTIVEKTLQVFSKINK